MVLVLRFGVFRWILCLVGGRGVWVGIGRILSGIASFW